AVRLLSSSGKSWTYTTDPEDAITVVGRQGWSVEPSYECQHAATAGNVLRLLPPLIIDDTGIDHLITAIGQALTKLKDKS
ncbi:MAG: hypothetical protein KDB77_12785, partial [Flavobacteriales bacterium]|nr:hypothetical protein [Flavobacteriales bacterium]